LVLEKCLGKKEKRKSFTYYAGSPIQTATKSLSLNLPSKTPTNGNPTPPSTDPETGFGKTGVEPTVNEVDAPVMELMYYVVPIGTPSTDTTLPVILTEPGSS